MQNIYSRSEKSFEKLASVVMSILGNSITFIIALFTVIFWLCNKEFYTQSIHECLRDLIHGITFLCIFIIQKSFNRFSASLHLKVNELVSSHEPASNAVINTEAKTERELNELSKEYHDLAEQEEQKPKHINNSLE